MESQIKRERISHNWTQEYVAMKVGISKQAIHLIETEKRRPSFDVLVKLLELFEKKEAVKEIRELFKETNLPT